MAVANGKDPVESEAVVAFRSMISDAAVAPAAMDHTSIVQPARSVRHRPRRVCSKERAWRDRWATRLLPYGISRS